jgi:hypothetical protein
MDVASRACSACGGSDGVAGGATVGVASTGELKLLFPRSVPLSM